MPKRKVNNKILGSGILYAVIVLTILTTVLAGGVIAKYVKTHDLDKRIFYAQEFYFSSDMLTEDGKALYVLNSNSTSVTFKLGNNADLLRWTDGDIKYTVNAVKEDASMPGNEPTVKVDDVELPAGTEAVLAHAPNNVTTATITVSGLKSGATYVVTATGRNGYEKTLSAKFKVSDKEENIYKHLDTSNDEYVLLTVWTKNLVADADMGVQISWNAEGLIPDNTDSVMSAVYNYKDSVYAIGSFVDKANFRNVYSSHTYRFFRNSADNFTVDNFEVKLREKAGNDDVNYEAIAGNPQ